MAEVIALRDPQGNDIGRKIQIVKNLRYYVGTMIREIRRADVVHVPVPGDMDVVGMIVALFMRKRLIVRYSGSWTRNDQTSTANVFTKFLMRRFAGGRNVMFATGEGNEPPARGISWLFSTAMEERELRGITPSFDRQISRPPRLAYVGRLSPEKGVVYLLKAMALLSQSKSGPVPHLTLVGDGPQRAVLERMMDELGCRSNVTFAGQQNREGLSAILSRTDLCVQPSLTEGFSKAWLDAFAHGVPVVASDVGAARGVILGGEGRGWIVRPGDEKALADQLVTIFQGPTDWPRLRRRCRQYVEGRTVEAWSESIGRVCAEQWGMTVENGKLRL
jgi:glycosyltransferase involved in cell wall biosynthesis